MKFGTYKTFYRDLQAEQPSLITVPESVFYQQDYAVEWTGKFMPLRHFDGIDADMMRFMAEGIWTDHQRPFYNVYPYIAKCAMSFDVSEIRRVHVINSMLMPSMCCLFEENAVVDSMLVGLVYIAVEHGRQLVLFFQARKKEKKMYGWLPLALISGDNDVVSDYQQVLLDDAEDSAGSVDAECSAALNIAVFMALAQSNKDLFEPIICDKYKHLPHDEAVKKSVARRGGQQCWSVGKSIESTPHYRRPHLATFWTGKGASVPCIKLRQGCVASREKATKMPTGYLLGKNNDTNSNNHSS